MTLKNVIESIYIVLPLVLIAFLLLMYITIYLWKMDANVIRARIFLNYAEFKKSFQLLSIFAFLLLIHVSLIYVKGTVLGVPAEDLQPFFGLTLAITMATFAYFIFKSIKKHK